MTSPLIGVGLNALGSLSVAKIDISSTGTIVSGVSGQVIRCYKAWLVAASAVTIQWKSGTTALSGAASLITGVPLVLPADSLPWETTNSGDDLILALGGSVQVSGQLYYVQS
jgi:hypothetical protein